MGGLIKTDSKNKNYTQLIFLYLDIQILLLMIARAENEVNGHYYIQH